MDESAHSFLPSERMAQGVDDFRSGFAKAAPYSHLVIDGLFDDKILTRVAREFRGLGEDPAGRHWQTRHEDKFTSDGERGLSDFTKTFLHHLNSSIFIDFVEQATGLRELIGDPEPGTHEVFRGGRLAVHADYTRHPRLGLERRLNLFVYLNEDWKEEYGGHLELWDGNEKKCTRKILPTFNRTVIFPVTDKTFHGHPEPLACPATTSRRSLGVIYYSRRRPRGESRYLSEPIYLAGPGEGVAQSAKRFTRRLLPPAVIDLLRRSMRGG